jgi:7-keto-8-aminopelargonate synthetase-like enzyme
LIDGIRAAKTAREIYAHAQLPPRNARRGNNLIISETLFGMDGDTIDVARLVEELGDGDILLIDEAHALGILGPEGAGLAHGIADERIVVLGTLGKAIGSAGGFIAGPAAFVDLLVNAARTFIFDTAPPPAIAFAARVGIMLARTADDRRARLFAKTARLRDGLRELGFAAHSAEGPIVPVVVGEEQRAMELMHRCIERGVYAPAVRPPTVPPGTSRLRVSMRADHTDEQVDLLLDALACVATS